MQRRMTALSATVVALGMAVLTGLIFTAGSQESSTDTYFNGRPVKVAMKELEPDAAAAVIARRSPLFTVYCSDGCEPEGQMFVKVLDSIESDGTSTLWRLVQIEFNPGYPCHQFMSIAEINSAVKSGEISLNPTGYVYRCRVIGTGASS
jgi:hypothetical protein